MSYVTLTTLLIAEASGRWSGLPLSNLSSAPQSLKSDAVWLFIVIDDLPDKKTIRNPESSSR
jgi:hypothetical protein